MLTMSTTSMSHLVKFEPENLAVFSEAEMLTLILRLVSIFADLQRAKIAHRSINPANLVIVKPNKKKGS